MKRDTTDEAADVRAQVFERCWKMEATPLRLRNDPRTAHCVRARAIDEMLGHMTARLSEKETPVPEIVRSQFLFDIDVAPTRQ
jgi:hypothetical protein